MTDQEIVQTVRQHFDSDIARELRPSVVRSVSELIEMLESIENKRETRRLRLESRNNAEKHIERYSGDSDNKLMRRNQASTRIDDSRTNPLIRDRASRTRVQPSIGWRKANLSEGSRSVDIVELPASDEENAKPVITRYTLEQRINKSRDNKKIAAINISAISRPIAIRT